MKKLLVIGAMAFILTNLFGCRQSSQNSLNEDASILNLRDLKENPLLLHPLTSSLDPNNNTMATLYVNDLGMKHLRIDKDQNYPMGTILYQVTWLQKPDPVWFGAKIPGKILSVEQVTFDDHKKPYYTLYKDSKIQKQPVANFVQERIQYIISQRMAVSP